MNCTFPPRLDSCQVTQDAWLDLAGFDRCPLCPGRTQATPPTSSVCCHVCCHCAVVFVHFKIRVYNSTNKKEVGFMQMNMPLF